MQLDIGLGLAQKLRWLEPVLECLSRGRDAEDSTVAWHAP